MIPLLTLLIILWDWLCVAARQALGFYPRIMIDVSWWLEDKRALRVWERRLRE